MYIAAGLAVAKAAASPWQDVVRRRIFEPLGMTGAVFTRSEVRKTPDHASPHRRDKDGKLRTIEWYDDDHQVRASGSIKASARDLARWVRFQLGDGTFEGKRLLSARGLAETHMPQTVIRLEGLFQASNPETTQMSYGLGWIIQDYRGRLLYTHSGGLEGFRSRIVLVPKERLGIVLLMNADVGASRASMHLAVTNSLLDLLLKLPRKDWNAHYAGLVKKLEEEARAVRAARQAKRHKGTKPSKDLEAYTGLYLAPAYGLAAVTRENGALLLRWSSFRMPLEHFHFDTFLTGGDPLVAEKPVVFTLGSDGEVAVMTFMGVSFRKIKVPANGASGER